MRRHSKKMSILPKGLRAKFTVHKEIGRGGCSVVRLCRDKVTGEEFIVKIIDKNNDVDAMNEINILKELDHANIIKYIMHEDTRDKLFLVTEYIKGGTLKDALLNDLITITHQDVAFIMVQLMNGLSYLHSLEIIHRDITLCNIFIEYIDHKVSAVKIGDFGMAAKLKDGIQTGLGGTLGFIAPEMYGMVYNFKVDIFSAGIVLRAISTPLEELRMIFALLCLLGGPGALRRLERPDHNLLDLIGKMTEVNPMTRYSTKDVLNHTWIQENLQ